MEENEYIEFKESLAQKRKGLIAMASMLNKHGSCEVLFGVDNSGKALGKTFSEKSATELRQEIDAYLKPRVIPTIDIEQDKDGKDFIRVRAKGTEVPYSAYGEYRIRVHQEDVQIDPSLMRKMIYSPENDPISKIPSAKRNLHFVALKDILSSHGNKEGKEEYFAENEGLTTPEGEFNLTGELLSDECPFVLQISEFDGTDRTRFKARKEFGGKSLLLSLQQVLDYVDARNVVKVILGSGKRKNVPLFDQDSFREAFVNACLHTRWQDGDAPYISIYSNRLVITSYGGLPFGLSKEDFLRGKKKIVNKALADIFAKADYAEKGGHGVPYIIGVYGVKAFEISDNFVEVTIPFNESEKPILLAKDKPLSETQRRIFLELKEDPDATRAVLSSKTGFAQSTVSRVLLELQQNQYIHRVGSRKNGYWAIDKDLL